MFEVDCEAVDFDAKNDRQTLSTDMIDDAIQEGFEVISKENSTINAYIFFSELEETGQYFKPPQDQESGGWGGANSTSQVELPSA